MKISGFTTLALAGLLFFACGCYQYTPPPLPTEEDVYTGRKKALTEEHFNSISVLSLEDAQKIAVKNNPDYISVYHAFNAAKMRYYQSFGAYFPTVKAESAFGKNYNNPSGITATWLLFDGLIREMNMLMSKYEAENKKMLEENSRRLLMNSVALAYNSILLTIEQQRIARADMEFQLKNMNETQLKYQAGAVPLSEVLNFKILVNVATGNQITAEYKYNIAVYTMSALMGLPSAKIPVHIKFPPISSETENHLASVDVYLDTALNNRPDLKGFRSLVQVAEYGVYRTYGAYSPTVSAYGNLSYGTNLSHYGGNGTGTNPSHTYSNNAGSEFGITGEWLIFNGWKRENIVREAKAELARAKFNTASNWISIIQEVRGAYDGYIQSVKQAKLYEKTLLLVIKQRDLVEEEYKAGNTELTRLNEAQRDLVQADTNLVGALVNVRNAKAQLDASTNTNLVGADIPSNIPENVEIN
jgi:outer membrane protein TolC